VFREDDLEGQGSGYGKAMADKAKKKLSGSILFLGHHSESL
jgi:hypothetical protein